MDTKNSSKSKLTLYVWLGKEEKLHWREERKTNATFFATNKSFIFILSFLLKQNIYSTNFVIISFKNFQQILNFQFVWVNKMVWKYKPRCDIKTNWY